MTFNFFADIFQIITNAFLIIGGIIAIWQYCSSKQNEMYHYNKERIELAIERADYYKENVLIYSRELKEIIEVIGVLDISENIKLEDIQYFDFIECERVYKKKHLKDIKKTREKYGIDKTVEEKSVSYRTISNNINNIQLKPNDDDIDDEDKIKKIGKQYVDLMFKILNNIEIFSMYFVHETADESVVYQPLHMSFLEIVRLLYYDIAFANRNGEKKFYVNTIKLFNIWKEKSLNQQNIETETIRGIADEGNILHKGKTKNLRKKY